MRYTVVGLWMDVDPPQRMAAAVDAQDPDEAIEKAAAGDWDSDQQDFVGDLLVAGVFEGDIKAVDSQ